MESKTYLTTKQTCELFSLTGTTLRKLRKDGIIRAKKLGGTVYYIKEEIEDSMINIEA